MASLLKLSFAVGLTTLGLGSIYCQFVVLHRWPVYMVLLPVAMIGSGALLGYQTISQRKSLIPRARCRLSQLLSRRLQT